MPTCHQLQANLLGTKAKLSNQFVQMLTAPMLGAQRLKAFERRTGQRRRLAGGVDVRSGELDQAFDQFFAARDKCTAGAKCLAQRSDQYRHIVSTQAKMFGNPAAIGAQRTKTVGIVYHQPGTLGPGFTGQSGEVGQIAVHAEYAIGDHQRTAAGFFQTLGKATCIVMQVAVEARPAQQTGIQQGGMVEAVFSTVSPCPTNAVTAPMLAMYPLLNSSARGDR